VMASKCFLARTRRCLSLISIIMLDL
jgi:hypothetical protein